MRMTKYQMEQFAAKVVAETYEPLFERHKTDGAKLIEKILRHNFGSSDLATFRALSEKFHSTTYALQVYAQGERHSIQSNVNHVLPAHSTTVDLKGHALGSEAIMWGREMERLKTERKSVYDKIVRACQTLRSREKIAQEWPEAVKHLPTDGQVLNLPAIPIADIKATLAAARTPPA